MEEYEQADNDSHMSPVIEIWEEIEEDSQDDAEFEDQQNLTEQHHQHQEQNENDDGGNSGNQSLKVNERGIFNNFILDSYLRRLLLCNLNFLRLFLIVRSKFVK